MYKAKSEHTIAFDVDDTLIMWEENYTQPFHGAVAVTCPHDGAVTYHKPHKRHIGFLKKQYAKGYTVIVWSNSGVGWANAVIEALGIADYVDIVVSKPNKWVDDLSNPASVLGTHIYLGEDGYST